MMQKCGIVIAAGGSGQRFGADKLMIEWNGKPIFMHVVEQSLNFSNDVVIVVPKDKIETYKKLLPSNIKIVSGGETRSKSVYKGLLALNQNTQWVAIVDAARPCLTQSILHDTFNYAQTHQCGCVYGTCVTNTTKLVENGVIKTTLDRTTLFSAETPQVFEKERLIFGYNQVFKLNLNLTDDAMVYEFLEEKVIPFYHESSNPKITYPSDLQLLNYEKKN